jgi:beta-galactosidase beta subunit
MDQKLSKNPYYVQAMDYIKSHDLNELATGHHQIDGEDLYVNIVDSQMKTWNRLGMKYITSILISRFLCPKVRPSG